MFVQHTLCRTSLAGLNFSFPTRAAKCASGTPGYPPDATSFCKALARLCRRVWCSCRCGIRADETAERVDPEPPVVFAVPAPPSEPFSPVPAALSAFEFEFASQVGFELMRFLVDKA